MRFPGCFLLWLCATAALPNGAAADEGMCVEGSHLWSVDLPPASMPELTDARASLAPATTLEAQLSRATRSEPSQPILWCSSPDDPRCRPAHGAPEGPPVQARDVGSCIATTAVRERTCAMKRQTPRPSPRGEPRPGFIRAPDKPPRGHR